MKVLFLIIQLIIFTTTHLLCYHLPTSNFSGLISTPIIFVAPAFLHPITTARPTAPRPHTAQVDPGSTYREKNNEGVLVILLRSPDKVHVHSGPQNTVTVLLIFL